MTDAIISALDTALRTLCSQNPAACMPSSVPPASNTDAHPTTPPTRKNASSQPERELSGALMRVNHVGEVCAQALYSAQALGARVWGEQESLAQAFDAAGREESQHLAWTRQRLDELGARPSLLNPLWYAGAFALGLVASRLGTSTSLGFVVETERQVEAHLAEHLERLPANDTASRAVVAQMKADEARHAQDAQRAGAAELPPAVKLAMKAAAKVMTTVAHRV